MTAVLRTRTGATIPLEVGRWRADPDGVELAMMEGLGEPVLDIGCGPGRIVAALGATGRLALGVDTSPVAVAEAGRRGASVLHRSIFDPLPGEGRWGSAVLLDGNIGIGGDPVALLGRVRTLLAPEGQAIVEVEAPGTPMEILTVRVEGVPGAGVGPWFPWARVGADDFASLATQAGLLPAGFTVAHDRWFARAVRPQVPLRR